MTTHAPYDDEPVVITGLGMVASTGDDRESVWRSVREGTSNIRRLRSLPGIPDDKLIGATCELGDLQGQLKTLPLALRAADEAVADAQVRWPDIDYSRFGCSISAHMGDTRALIERAGGPALPEGACWWDQWLPNTACWTVAHRYGLGGPRTSYSTACASSLVCFLSAVRSIRDGQCDIAIAGGADSIDPLFAAGFYQMGVLAEHEDPNQACRPFDRARTGFVMGEGAAMLVVERLSHALARGAKIYAVVRAEQSFAQAHHVTGLDTESESLVRLIRRTLDRGQISPDALGYINAHGTGTELNDLAELKGIRQALGAAADQVCVSSTKSVLGHMVNAAGAAELAVTVLALRDGFAPPTINLTDPDPACTFDCVPLIGRTRKFQHALKVAVAFGGHLVGIALSRWNDAATGFAYPDEQTTPAAARVA